MQKHYVHRVPPKRSRPQQTGNEPVASDERYAIIFRDGLQVMVENDSGIATDGHAPDRTKVLNFGQDDKLTEGCCYKREAMMRLGLHR
jgi:hypothetical protein